ncbi:MAG TPA: hypothetical protein VHD90_21395 [Phototrophicaceae bacterium]|nr:hypothetical protein [Phototrophicaceae bacterium]
MEAPNLSNSTSLPNADDEFKRQQLLAEFPKGIAPYSSSNLIGFGLFGGILGAGIAGAVNYRRANQSRSIPGLLLISLVVLFAYEFISNFLLDKFLLANNLSDQFHFVGNTVSLVVGIGFSLWIASRQRQIIQRWSELAGKTQLREQGGCLTALGWIVLSWIISVALILGTNTAIGQATLQVTYPAQTYTTQGVSVTLPTGWFSISPSLLNVDCSSSAPACLAIAQDGWSGSNTVIRLLPNSGTNAQAFSAASILSVRSAQPTATISNPQPYTAPALANHPAYTFSGTLNGVDFIFTFIEDGDSMINLLVNCTDTFQGTCSSLRDQIVSTMQFAPGSGAAATDTPLPRQ